MEKSDCENFFKLMMICDDKIFTSFLNNNF